MTIELLKAIHIMSCNENTPLTDKMDVAVKQLAEEYGINKFAYAIIDQYTDEEMPHYRVLHVERYFATHFTKIYESDREKAGIYVSSHGQEKHAGIVEVQFYSNKSAYENGRIADELFEAYKKECELLWPDWGIEYGKATNLPILTSLKSERPALAHEQQLDAEVISAIADAIKNASV